MNEMQLVRTLSIVKQLSKGKHLFLDDRCTIAMGEDMTIGFLYAGGVVSGMTLVELNKLCEEYGIGMAIPERK